MISYDIDLKTFYSSKISDRNFVCGFGTKATGDARSLTNIQNFFSQNNIVYNSLVVLEQIHSANVEIVPKDQPEALKKIEETDGVITEGEQIMLTIKTADCIPIIFADKKAGVIGISHQGWRGSLKKLQQRMVEAMVKIGAKKDSILAAIGPSIGECCYHIEEDRYYSFFEEFDGYSDKIFHMRGGKHYLNLPLLNFMLLKDSGVKPENIDYFPFCTSCDRERFFSYRRDKNKEYGEMLSFIMKNNV